MTAINRILCFGDSNTWGYNPIDGSRFPESVRWTSLLQEKLRPLGITILEAGRTGRTASFEDPLRENLNGLKTLSQIINENAPFDAAIIMIGSNDCKPCFGADARRIAVGMEACADLLLQVIPADRLIIASPILLGDDVPAKDPDFNEESVKKSKQLAAEYKMVADTKGAHFIAASEHAQPGSVDSEHLDEKGHSALAETFYKAIIDL